MGEPDCCLSCKTAASATIGNRPLRIRTVGGVGGRREYPHASYPIANWLTVRQSFGSPVPNFSVRMRADRTPAALRASAAAFMKPAGPQRR